VAWAALAPTAPVGELPSGALYAPTAPELGAAQDGTLALLAVAAGALCGAGLAVRPGTAPVRRSLAVLAGSVLGSLVAWRLGVLLGPAPLAEQVAADPDAMPVSPLRLGAPGVLLVWPVVAMAVATAAHLAAAWRGAGDQPEAGRPEVTASGATTAPVRRTRS
jgi:hypothetical protein